LVRITTGMKKWQACINASSADFCCDKQFQGWLVT